MGLCKCCKVYQCILHLYLCICNGNAKSQLETVIEHLVGRQGQPKGAQVHAMHLSDQKGWSQDPLLPRPHLRVGSGGEGVLLEIPAYLRPSKGKQTFSFVSVPTAAALGLILTCCSLGPCYSTVNGVLSCYSVLFKTYVLIWKSCLRI